MRITVGLLLKLGQAALVAVAVVVVTVIQLNQGTNNPWLIWGCALVIGIGGSLDPALRAAMAELGELSFATRLEIEQPLIALVDAIDKAGPLTFRDIGVTAFLTRRTRRHPFRGVQLRVARIRFRANPRPTEIAWTRRKGLLGQVWQDGRPHGFPHASIYGPLVANGESGWKDLPKKDRHGLSWKEVNQLVDFGYVEAHPMKDATGHYHGCLVIQVDEAREDNIKQEAVQALIQQTAATVAAIVAR